MNNMKCLHCSDGLMTEEVYAKAVKRGRRSIDIAGLKHFKCASCEGEIVTRAQTKENSRLIDEAFSKEVAATVNTETLKQLRKQFNLSQREASILFGAGESSFAKWESGQTTMSGPAALLVKCASHIPGLVEYLAHLHGQEVKAVLGNTDDLDWNAASQETRHCVKNNLLVTTHSGQHHTEHKPPKTTEANQKSSWSLPDGDEDWTKAIYLTPRCHENKPHPVPVRVH